MIRSTLVAAAVAGVTAYVALPTEADACGGTFCDAGPTAMPVDQTGEVILFVMGQGYTEAHIQIEYDPETEADKFAWVIPLMEVPEFSVGSQPLFDNVLAGTVPSYGFNTQFDDSSCDFGDDGGGGESGAAGGGTGGDTGAGDEGGGPDIVLQEVVGAFEVTVLQGGTAEELVAWLDENGYQQDPNATPILEQYLAENYLFAAFKLTNDAETSEIHPVTLRFPVEEACVPLRLTRIAAVDDMDIRTFFLADHRVVPQNYKHVLVNPLKLDWTTQASNYKEVITMAVDADQAGGRAFVTEYAGPSNVVGTFGIWESFWNSAVFETIDPENVVNALQDMSLMTCFEDWDTGNQVCDYTHPLMRSLMLKYLPPPADVPETEFYGCLECYSGLIDREVWDPAGFATDLETRIIAPGAHAVEVLQAFPTLTRMYTTISPFEMTEDPFFHQNPDLQPVDNTNQIATRTIDVCGTAEVWELPDGRQVYTPDGSWPAFPNEMPWEEEVEETPEQGAPIVLSNQTELINRQLEQHNCQYNYPSPNACGDPDGETSGLTTDGGGSDGGTGGADGGGLAGRDSGCGCQADPDSGPWGGLMGLSLLGLGFLRRRRG